MFLPVKRYCFRAGLVLAMMVIITGFLFAFPCLASVTGPGSPGGDPFSDIRGHWARQPILRLAALDLIRGYPDGTCRPDRSLTRLELVALIMRVGDFEKAAAAAGRQQTKAPIQTGAATPEDRLPRAPWGQDSLTLAVQKGFLPPEWVASFDPDGEVTRAETAALLARSFYLPPPGEGGGNSPAPAGFPDLDQAPAAYRPYISAVAAAGVMSGYPDGTFQPERVLSRAEMAAILSGLLDRNWVKVPPGRRLEGWISGISTAPGRQELELTSLSGVQKLRVNPGCHCFAGGVEYPLEQSGNHRAEVILDNRRQVSFINLLEGRTTEGKTEKMTGSVKSVALGEDNLLVLNDLNCEDHILPLAWDAVLAGKNARQDFRSLKTGAFVDVELQGGMVKKVTLLDTKKISGTVGMLTGKTLTFKDGYSQKGRPDSFIYWDRARIVDKDDRRAGGIQRGDRVEITYVDPIPDEIQDERVLQIKITSPNKTKKQTGVLQSIDTGDAYRIVLQKDREYAVDPAVRVTDLNNRTLSFSDLNDFKDRNVELELDGANVVVSVRVLQ
ncbi:MAG TPA: S-layer homology domain-containing protein [Desulfotomaculum sp.]|nr:S-layer homology domain-containing protein [Desulfotomaculum sp.]